MYHLFCTPLFKVCNKPDSSSPCVLVFGKSPQVAMLLASGSVVCYSTVLGHISGINRPVNAESSPDVWQLQLAQTYCV